MTVAFRRIRLPSHTVLGEDRANGNGTEHQGEEGTVRIAFAGDLDGLEAGFAALAPRLGIEIGNRREGDDGGLTVTVEQVPAPVLEVRREGDTATIRAGKRAHVFRALGLLVEASREGEGRDTFAISETPQFTMNGPMIDVSQGNAVPRVETVQRLLRTMALMGLDMLMLYAEDSYDVPGQPWFGYLRGRYSADDIRRIDDEADMLGIELIPCIQTLSHLRDVLRWDAYADLRDDDETLLVGDERTYALIEQLIVAASAPVRTKRIHIGMDEAWHLGLGRYLDQNGYHTKFEIMNEHLNRVMAIVRKHGLEPMIWSDMYFRAGSRTGDYYDREIEIPRSVIDRVPDDVRLVYWDYYHADEAFYVDWIRRHAAFGATPVFAGGIWNWNQIALNYGWTFAATNAAMAACKREGVTEVIATIWGDDGTECDLDAVTLGLQLFAEHGFAASLDEAKLARRFAFCTGGNMDDVRALGRIDEPPGVPAGNPGTWNPSRYLLWQNVLLGLFDANVPPGTDAHYAAMAAEIAQCAGRNGDFAPMFAVYERLCDVLALKAELGVRLAAAYRAGDRDALRTIAAETFPTLRERVRALREVHRARWHALHQPFGWEVIDARYGGLLQGLDTAAWRIGDFLAGSIDRIEELEAERLPYNGRDGHLRESYHGRMASASRLVWYTG
jgi:hexosaminidase